ncbi:MAG: hypothetical protein QXO24_03420 [Candidatus Micrarchaeaceae archaeon]
MNKLMGNVVLPVVMFAAFAALTALTILQFNVQNVSAATSNTANAVANVAVGNVIYIALTPNTINFGAVYPNSLVTTTPAANIIDTDNGGNLAANIFISGTAWSFNGYTFGVSNTFWSASSAYSPNTALSNTLSDTHITIPQPTISAPSQSNTIYFEISIPANTPPGNYLQTVTFQNENLASATNSVAANATFSANVQGVCYISLAPTSISFGSLYANTNSIYTSQNVVDTNGGNVNAQILVYGGNWIGPSQFGLSNTTWASSNNVAYASGRPLTASPTPTGIYIAPQASNSIYFGLGVPGGVAAGSYSQNIIIQNSC